MLEKECQQAGIKYCRENLRRSYSCDLDDTCIELLFPSYKHYNKPDNRCKYKPDYHASHAGFEMKPNGCFSNGLTLAIL